MPKLKCEKKTIIEVDYSDLDEFVNKIYKTKDKNSRFEFCCNEECGNDSSHTFRIDGKLGQYDISDWNERREQNKLPTSNYLVLNKLCADGYIEPGEYLVEVCW